MTEQRPDGTYPEGDPPVPRDLPDQQPQEDEDPLDVPVPHRVKEQVPDEASDQVPDEASAHPGAQEPSG